MKLLTLRHDFFFFFSVKGCEHAHKLIKHVRTQRVFSAKICMF